MTATRQAPPRPPSGHVFRVDRKRGAQWYAKYRLPDGRQIQRKLGPAWTERGRPGTGYFTKRTAEAWLRDVLDEARCGTLPGLVKTDVTFAEAADEWLRYVEQDRGRKPSTIAGYRALLNSQLLPVFGEMPIESITTPEIEAWIGGVDRSAATRTKALVLMHGIFKRAATMQLSGPSANWSVRASCTARVGSSCRAGPLSTSRIWRWTDAFGGSSTVRREPPQGS